MDRVIVQAEALETTGLEIFDEDIGAGSEFVGQMQVRGIVKIEDDRALVAVDGQVVGGHPMAVWWHPAPGVIPGGAFNLDHRRTQITQQHGAVRTGEYSREVGDQQAIERPGLLVGFLPGFLVVLLWHKCTPPVVANGRHERMQALLGAVIALGRRSLSVLRTAVRKRSIKTYYKRYGQI